MPSKIEKYLFWFLLALLPSQLGYHWWPSWSLVSGVRVDYLSPTLYFTDLIVVGIFLTVRKVYLTKKVFIGCVLLAVVNIITSLIPSLTIYSWLRLLEYIWLGHYIFYNWQRLEKIAKPAMVIAVVWTSILAWGQFFGQHSLGGWWYWLGERTFNISTPGIARNEFFGTLILRSYATLPHPNVLAAWLLLSMFLIFSWVKSRRSIIFLGLLLTGSTMFIAGSRSSMLGLVFVLMGLLIARVKSGSVKIISVIVSSIVIGAIFLLPHNPQSGLERLTLLRSGWSVFMTHPLFGVGLGNHIVASGNSLLAQTNFKLALQPVHNVYLLAISEIGIVGLVVLTFALKSGVNLWRRLPYYWQLVTIAILGLGMIDHYWWTLHQASLLLTILLAVIALKSKTHEQIVYKL